MGNESILDRIREIVAEATGMPVHRISSKSSAETIEGWDLAAQARIIRSMEREFGAYFTPGQIARMSSVVGIWLVMMKLTYGEDNDLLRLVAR